MDFKSDWIIAEIGSVHDGSFGNALKLVEAASNAGANCVKFQTHIAEAETLSDAPMPPYFKGENRLDYFRRTSFTSQQWKELADAARFVGVLFLSSPFSLEAVDLLEEVGVQAYKVPSGEITNLPLIQRIAETGKPVLLSSGMSTWEELGSAVSMFEHHSQVCVMQCTSAYPTPPEKVGLNNLREIAVRFPGVVLGYSDHTMGIAAGVAAVTLGADVIEKHFTFSRLMYGSDAQHSMEPNEFHAFSRALREAWLMRRNPIDKNELAKEELSQMKLIFQKSIVAAHDLLAGQALTLTDLAFKKPGDGISAAEFRTLIGRKLRLTVPSSHKFRPEDFE